MKHILSADSLNEQDISELFCLTDKLRNNEIMYGYRAASGKVLGSLFFEPSTRTRWSTEAAMIRMGGEVLSMEYAKESSSDRKGESLRDTLKTCSQYVDVLCVRHPVENSIQDAASFSECPVINGGDGTNEHPTQALLDLYTILKHFKEPHGKHILFTGDMTCSRTIHSLAKLLSPYSMTVTTEGPASLDYHAYGKGIHHVYRDDVYAMLPKIDILYMTRHQKERATPREQSQFTLTKELACTMKRDAIIMHPLPRTSELSPEVDSNPRAVYFEQAKNGMWVRMALLWKLLNISVPDSIAEPDSGSV